MTRRHNGYRSGCAYRLFLFPLMLLIAALGITRAGAEEYRLGPQDKIRLKAYEWRASRDEVVEWKALNDEFVIGADGLLSIPFAGDVPAEGLSPSELARVIAEKIQAGMELGRAPDMAVEVVKFRPFYIVGHVESPGEYEYRPSLTVLKALGIAGGLQRSADRDPTRITREVITTRGELSLLSTQANSLLARKARVQAELNKAESISFPTELEREKDNPVIALIMQQEQLIFDARREAFDTQLRALAQLKEHLAKEIVSLEGQVKTEDTQVELVEKELNSVKSLVERGLSVAPRQLSLERTLAQIEGDRLRVGTALLKARQEISKTDITIIELQNKRADEATTVLRETQTRLDELARRFDTAEQLLYESEVIAPRSLAQRDRNRKTEPIYTIVRQRDGQVTETRVTESTRVEPGDTIKVEMPLSRDRGPFADKPAEPTVQDKTATTTSLPQSSTP